MSTKYELKGTEIHREGVKIADRDPSSGKLEFLPGQDKFRAPTLKYLQEIGEDKAPDVPPEVAARQAKARQAGAAPEDVSVAPSDEVRATVPAPDRHDDAAPADPLAKLRQDLEAMQAQNRELMQQLSAARVSAPVASHGGQPAATPAPQAAFATDAINAQREVQVAREQETLFRSFEAEGCPRRDPQMGTKTPGFIRWVAKNKPDYARQIWASAQVFGGRHIEEIIIEEGGK